MSAYELCDMKIEGYNQLVFCVEPNVSIVSSLAVDKNDSSFWISWGNSKRKYDFKDILYMRVRDIEYGDRTMR
jgi:hypothetical protein